MVTFNRPKAGVILSKHQITSFCCSKRSHGSVSQLRTNSSPQPSRSYVIWLLLLLYCTHSDPPKQDSVLLLEHRRYAPNFALAVPPYWNTLLPYDMTHSLTSNKSFFKCHALRLTLITLFEVQLGLPISLLSSTFSRVPSKLLNDLLLNYIYLHSQGKDF